MSKANEQQMISLREDCILVKVTSDALHALRESWGRVNCGLGFVESMSRVRNGFWRLDFRRSALDGSELKEADRVVLREFTLLAVQEILADIGVVPTVLLTENPHSGSFLSGPRVRVPDSSKPHTGKSSSLATPALKIVK